MKRLFLFVLTAIVLFVFLGCPEPGSDPDPIVVVNAPYATNVNITGSLSRGEDLTVNYTYNDDQNDTEGLTVFQWQSSSDPTSGFTDISGATASSYTLLSADIGKYILAQVTVVASSGSELTGTPVSDTSTGVAKIKIVIDGVDDVNDDWSAPGVISVSDDTGDHTPGSSNRYDLTGYKIGNDDTNLYIQIALVGDSNDDTSIVVFYIDLDPGTTNGVDLSSIGNFGFNRPSSRRNITGPNHYVDGVFYTDWSGITRLITSHTETAGAWDVANTAVTLERNPSSTLVELKIPISSLSPFLTKGSTFEYRLFTTGTSDSDAAFDVGGITDEKAATLVLDSTGISTIFTNAHTGDLTYTVQ